MNDTVSNSPMNRRRILVAGSSLLVLSGCGHLFGPENAPGQLYVLSPPLPAAAATTSRLPWQLAVAKAEASESLATDRIAIRRGAIMDYYADAQWSDAVPALLQNLLVEALEKNGALMSVASDVAGIRADYILQTEVHAFEARYDNGDAAPVIVVDLTVKLIASRTAEILSARQFHQEQQASANSVAAAVAAFDQAVAAALQEIVPWVRAAAGAAKR